jgi:hypothetical protein
MILFQISAYDGTVTHEREIHTPEALEEALDDMLHLAKQWRKEGDNLDRARILSVSAPEDREDPDCVAAYVDESLRTPIVEVGGRLGDAFAMLRPQ